jgi:hypothetical protein
MGEGGGTYVKLVESTLEKSGGLFDAMKTSIRTVQSMNGFYMSTIDISVLNMLF